MTLRLGHEFRTVKRIYDIACIAVLIWYMLYSRLAATGRNSQEAQMKYLKALSVLLAGLSLMLAMGRSHDWRWLVRLRLP